MNRPRRPDAEWIRQVRAQNRARQGVGVGLSGIGRSEPKVPAWQAALVVLTLGYLAYKLLPR